MLKNCIQFGSDDAAMVGTNNLVWARLKPAAPDCGQFKSFCHSLLLCTANAVKKLPSNIGFLITKIF